MYPEYMKNSQHQNWIEDIAIKVNLFQLFECDKKKMIVFMRNETKYNTFQLERAYRILYENNKLIDIFNRTKYIRQ